MRGRWLGTLVFTSVAALAAGCGSSSSGGGQPADDTGASDDSSNNNGDTGSQGETSTDADLDSTTPTDTGGDSGPPPAARTTATNGSPVAITADDKVAIAVNRTAGSVTVFKLDTTAAGTITAGTPIPVGGEPWALIIGNDDDTAYVILRNDQKVVKITGLKETPAVDAASAKTGSEPTGIAISPTGQKLYVANWAEGTVSVINTADMSVGSTIDLNATAAPLLGLAAPGRPALAHPRAITVTNNGDTNDADETIYVTDFFSYPITPAPAGSNEDTNRQGIVYRLNAGTGTAAAPITIAPVADTGFNEPVGNTKTGCFPNQLSAVQINNNRLYITSNCASARGPNGAIASATPPTPNFKTEVHASVFVIDLATNAEVPADGLRLTQKFQDLFTANPSFTARFPLIPNDIVFAPGTNVAYVSAYGSNAVFRVSYNADGTFNAVGAGTGSPFIDLSVSSTTPPLTAGALPNGIAVTHKLGFAVAINENSRTASLISFNSQAVAATASSEGPPATPNGTPQYDTDVNAGKKFFVTGTGRWSLNGGAWNSCESCHPDGLTDNVTWYFARGPRQTISLDGTYDPQNQLHRRILNWTAINDEVHDFDGNTRANSGGVGAIVNPDSTPPVASDRVIIDGSSTTNATTTRQDGLNGSAIALMPGGPTPPSLHSLRKDWNQIDSFVKFIRAPKKPTNLDSTLIANGLTAFKANACSGCHATSQWTISSVFYTPGEANNSPGINIGDVNTPLGAKPGLLMTTTYKLPTGFPTALNPPAAAGPAPLRHLTTGCNATLNNSCFDKANDQISCILRAVGTFPASGTVGIVPSGGTAIEELRTDMATTAQGATGFNIPSLLGMVTGAPYFHAGNARTLEEVLDDTTFHAHHAAFNPNFKPTADDIKGLVQFLLSIDESTAPLKVTDSVGLTFSTDLCGTL